MRAFNVVQYNPEKEANKQADVFVEIKSNNFLIDEDVINIRHQWPNRNTEWPSSTLSSIQQAALIVKNVIVWDINKNKENRDLAQLQQLYAHQIATVLKIDENITSKRIISFFTDLLRKETINVWYEKADLDAVGSVVFFELLHQDLLKWTNIVSNLLKNIQFSRFVNLTWYLDRYGPIYKQKNHVKFAPNVSYLDVSYDDLILGLKTLIDDKSIDINKKVDVVRNIFLSFLGQECEEDKNLVLFYLDKGKAHYSKIESESSIFDMDEDWRIKFLETEYRLSIGAEIIYNKWWEIAVVFNPESKECFIVKWSPDIQWNFDTLFEKLNTAELEKDNWEIWIYPRLEIIRSSQKNWTALNSEKIKSIVQQWISESN